MIETPRLKLRPFSFEDLAPLKEILKDPEVMQFSFKGMFTDEQIEKLFQKTLENQEKYGFGALAIIHKRKKKWLGFCMLWREKEGDREVLDLGYRLFKKYWGKGYGAEAVGACCDYLRKLFPNEEIHVYISPENIPSIQVAEKSGMKRLGEVTYRGFNLIKYRI